MSDEELRRLERRFRETGTVDDEAGWLTGRLRAGTLTSARLEIAALLGHEASRKLLPRIKPPTEVAPILKALQRRTGGPGILRAMLALARRLDEGSEDSQLHRELLHEIEAWLLEPTKPVSNAGLTGGTPFEIAVMMCAEHTRAAEPGTGPRNFLVRSAGRTLTPAQCLHAISLELIPWALGYRDPVADRQGRSEPPALKSP